MSLSRITPREWVKSMFPDRRDEIEHERRLIALADRLRFQYGHTRTEAIMSGQDGRTEADLAAWGRVGSN